MQSCGDRLQPVPRSCPNRGTVPPRSKKVLRGQPRPTQGVLGGDQRPVLRPWRDRSRYLNHADRAVAHSHVHQVAVERLAGPCRDDKHHRNVIPDGGEKVPVRVPQQSSRRGDEVDRDAVEGARVLGEQSGRQPLRGRRIGGTSDPHRHQGDEQAEEGTRDCSNPASRQRSTPRWRARPR
jgi:hypothetical protein